MAEHTYGPYVRKALDGSTLWAKPAQGSPDLFALLAASFPGRPFRTYTDGADQFIVLKDDPALDAGEQVTLAAQYAAWDPSSAGLDDYKAQILAEVDAETSRRIIDLGFDYTDPNDAQKTLNFSLTIEGQLNIVGALSDAATHLAANGGTLTWPDRFDTDAIVYSTVPEVEDFCRAGLTQKQTRLNDGVVLKLQVRAVDTGNFAADKATIDGLVANYIAGIGA